MPNLRILGQKKIGTVKKAVKSALGVDFKIYDQTGAEASDDVTIGSIRTKKPEQVEVRVVGQTLVKNVIRFFESNYGIKVEVLTGDGGVADLESTLGSVKRTYMATGMARAFSKTETLQEWIKRQSSEEKSDPDTSLGALLEIVTNTEDQALPSLLDELAADPFSAVLEIPLWNDSATETFARIIDRLAPDAERSIALTRIFPIDWSMSMWGGASFEACVLMNGVILVRNNHRVLGPDLSKGTTLEMDPKFAETLSADLRTLRARNLDGEGSCFLLTHDAEGARLIGADEPVDLTALGWGQLIAVCGLEEPDLTGKEALRCKPLCEIGADARSGVVFLRIFGDRVDIIPAVRFDDELDILLEELAASYDLCEALEEGAPIQIPLQSDELISEIAKRASYLIEHFEDDSPGAVWFRDYALPALAKRLYSSMNWGTANFGLGPDPDGPRRSIPLPAGIQNVISADADLKRRSITLQVVASSETARGMILDGLIEDWIIESFEEVGATDVEITVTGRVDHDLIEGAEKLPLTDTEGLEASFAAAIREISARAEEEGEDPDEMMIDNSLGVVLLIDFTGERPSDLLIAAASAALSETLEDTVRLFLNGRGDYLAYEQGDEDSGDHGLFRLDR